MNNSISINDSKVIPSIELNLRTTKYDIETLEKNIDTICVKTCVNTQILTAEFCVKYILTPSKYLITT